MKSELEVPELLEVSQTEEDADVLIRESKVGPVTDTIDQTPGRDLETTNDSCRLTYESVGNFLVENGSRIEVDLERPDISQRKRFRHLLTNEVMSVLLHQRGYLVLHGSAVSVDGSGIVFLGQQGAGKSTTAAAFLKQGYSVLADDVVAIQLADDDIKIVPSVPEMRLLADAADALAIDDAVKPPGDRGPDKLYHTVDETVAAPLSKIYLLRAGNQIALKSVSGREALFSLIKSTYTIGLLSHTETTPDNFRQCSTISEDVPVSVLERPQDHTLLPELVQFVADDVKRC